MTPVLLAAAATFVAGAVRADTSVIPPNASLAAAADVLAAAEGLRSWNAALEPRRDPSRDRWGFRSRHSRDGRKVVVYFTARGRTICRVRRPHGGMSAELLRAQRWCAARLGVRMPAAQPPAR